MTEACLLPDGFVDVITGGEKFDELRSWYETGPSLKALSHETGESIVATQIELAEMQKVMKGLRCGEKTSYYQCDVELEKVNTRRKFFYLACGEDVAVGDKQSSWTRPCNKQL